MIMVGLRIVRSVAAICFLISGAATAAPVHKVHVWMKAFIPSEHPTLPNYIKKTAKGTYVIEAPNIPAVSQGAGGYPAFSPAILEYYKTSLEKSCFETDNRMFSNSQEASARVTIEYQLNIAGRKMTVEKFENRDFGQTGASHLVDCASGKNLGDPKKADTADVKVGSVKKDGFFSVLFSRAAVANPFYNFDFLGLPRISLSPDIDYSFTLRYDPFKQEIEFNGSTGTFPAFELYAQIDNHAPIQLLNRSPADGATATSLFDLGMGINTLNFAGKLKLTN